MTVEEIHEIRDAIIETAKLAQQADIDGIEIQCRTRRLSVGSIFNRKTPIIVRMNTAVH